MAKTRKKSAFHKGPVADSAFCYTILLKAYIVYRFKIQIDALIIKIQPEEIRVSLSDKKNQHPFTSIYVTDSFLLTSLVDGMVLVLFLLI